MCPESVSGQAPPLHLAGDVTSSPLTVASSYTAAALNMKVASAAPVLWSLVICYHVWAGHVRSWPVPSRSPTRPIPFRPVLFCSVLFRSVPSPPLPSPSRPRPSLSPGISCSPFQPTSPTLITSERIPAPLRHLSGAISGLKRQDVISSAATCVNRSYAPCLVCRLAVRRIIFTVVIAVIFLPPWRCLARQPSRLQTADEVR